MAGKETKRKTLRLMVLALALCMAGTVGLTSCAGETGAQGPQGPQGIQGEQGEKGDPGQDGKDGADGKNYNDIDIITPEEIEESFVQANGYTSGDLDAKGKFYTNFASWQDARDAAQELNIQMAQEGQVLLKNENNALPLGKNEKYVTLLGIGSVDTEVSGGGSGAASQTNYTTSYNWKTGLEAAGFHVNPKTWNMYEGILAASTAGSGQALEADMSYYSKSITNTYKGYGDAAIVVLHRYGTENKDLKTNNANGHTNPDDTELDLQDNEIALIKHAKEHFDKVVVILNSSNTMSLGELAEKKTDENLGVDAILWVGGVGQVGTYAAGTILSGEVNPSGHTVDTWWTDVKKDPTFTNMSDMSQNYGADGNRMSAFYTYNGTTTPFATVEFREGIYVGYRYTETGYTDMAAENEGAAESWYQDTVAYPFGYGLSYTEFNWQIAGISKNKTITAANQTLTVKVQVTNTGNVAGKDVVQLYYSAPYTAGEIEKAAANLAGFAKTDILEPGESEIVEIQLVAQDMASFDSEDANNNGFCGYELEAGEYVISARRSAHEVVLEETYTVSSDIRCETDYTTGNEISPVFVDDYTTVRDSLTNNMLVRSEGMTQPAAESNAERVLEGWEADMLYAQEFYRPYNDEEGQDWYVSEVPSTWTQGASTTVSKADLSGVAYVESRIGADGKAEATANDAGTKLWESYMNSLSYDEMFEIVADTQNTRQGTDGPVKFGSGTCWNTSPISAATYNVELLEEQGEMYGTEAIFSGRTWWNGGGVNLHRSPFNGRNFEYYSEDGTLSGIMGAAVTKGVVSKGVVSFYKHFFANVQEYKRAEYGGVATFATEQTFREIYLKAFERVVKAGSLGLMTSFNRVGYVVNSDNWAVHEDLLREEWGFQGATVTDMWAKNYVSLDLMARAGDDIVLGGSASFTDTYFSDSRWNATANCAEVMDEDGDNWVVSPTQYYAIRKSAQRVLYCEVNSNAMRNNAASLELTATVYQGVSNTAIVQCKDTSDFTMTLAEGEELPAGMTLNGFTVSVTAAVAEGTYTFTVDVDCDTWVSTTATLTVNVVNPIGYNDTYSTDNTINLKAGEQLDGVFGSEFYSYAKVIGNSAIANRYYSEKYGAYNRDEDKTAADIVTHAASEADFSDSRTQEVEFSIEGAPDWMDVDVVYGTVTGAAGGTFENQTGIRISGTAEAGTYTLTVTMKVPYVMSFNGWYFMSFGGGVWTITRTVTIVVA